MSTIQEDEIDIKELILTLIHGWKTIIVTTTIVFLIVFFYVRSLPDQYTLITQAASVGSKGGNSQMAGLAALAGVNVSSGSSDVNLLDYVEEVVKNGDFLDKVLFQKIKPRYVEKKWPIIIQKGIDSTTLSEYFEIEIDSVILAPDQYDFRLKRSLYSRMRSKKLSVFTVNFEKGILEIVTKFQDPELSFAIHQEVLIQLRDYFKNDYTLKDREKRIFIAERVSETADSLKMAENRVTRYLNIYPSLIKSEGAQSYIAPKVLMEYGRRKRVVEQYNAMYIELLKQFEMAKIDEKKEQPVFELIRKPELPLSSGDPNRKLLQLVGIVFGFCFGVILVFMREWITLFWGMKE